MANHWFKFYGGEYISDPKMLALSACERSCWVTLLCYASMDDFDGVIRYLSEEQLMVQAGVKYSDPEWNRTKGVLDHLQELGMLQQRNGEIIVTNWSKRQEVFLTNAERQARYRERWPEKSRKSAYASRLRKIGIEPEEWEEIKARFGNACAICKEKKELTLDHIIPTSKGGKNHISNYQPLCKSCNSSKKNNADVTATRRESNARLDKTRLDKTRNTAQFDKFWGTYPRKEGKKKAEQAFEKINPNETTFKAIMAGLKNHMGSEQWTKDNGKFVPHPTTWLNGERWNDEIKAGKTKSTKYDNIRTTTVR